MLIHGVPLRDKFGVWFVMNVTRNIGLIFSETTKSPRWVTHRDTIFSTLVRLRDNIRISSANRNSKPFPAPSLKMVRK